MQTIYKISIGVLLTFSFLNLKGQETLPEPEFTGNIYYIENGKAKPLEKQKASQRTKAGASVYLTGIGKAKSANVISGSSSSVRIVQNDMIKFIVKVADNTLDPIQVINIFKLEQNSKKDIRLIEIANAGTFSGSSANNIAFIPYEAEKYGTKSYLIKIQRPLAVGEYAITIEGNRELFNMFGID